MTVECISPLSIDIDFDFISLNNSLREQQEPPPEILNLLEEIIYSYFKNKSLYDYIVKYVLNQLKENEFENSIIIEEIEKIFLQNKQRINQIDTSDIENFKDTFKILYKNNIEMYLFWTLYSYSNTGNKNDLVFPKDKLEKILFLWKIYRLNK